MKYFKRGGLYKASNVTFDPDMVSAYSYDWWQFVRKIKGRVIFNRFPYSNTTIKHQYKVRALMREIGIRIDLEVMVADGLQKCKTLKELRRREAETLNDIAKDQENKRLERNKRARERRLQKKNELAIHSLKLIKNSFEKHINGD